MAWALAELTVFALLGMMASGGSRRQVVQGAGDLCHSAVTSVKFTAVPSSPFGQAGGTTNVWWAARNDENHVLFLGLNSGRDVYMVKQGLLRLSENILLCYFG